MSEAFGHQKLDKKMIPNDFNGNLLSGSDASCIGAKGDPERLSEVRDRRSPKPSGIRFPKLENKIITNKATHFQGAM